MTTAEKIVTKIKTNLKGRFEDVLPELRGRTEQQDQALGPAISADSMLEDDLDVDTNLSTARLREILGMTPD